MEKTHTVIDSFVQDHLPPKEQWPDFINTPSDSAAPSNCITPLLDNAIEEGCGNNIAIYSPTGNWTYLDLYEKTNQIARVLTEDFGLIPGNRVLLRSANNPMLAACWLAIIKAGGIAVTTIAMLRAKEITPIAAQSQASLALCDYRLKDEMNEAAKSLKQPLKTVYFNNPEPKNSHSPAMLETLMAAKPGTFTAYSSEQTDIAMMAFTSGTTGKPKGALHSHQAILAVCDAFSRQVIKPVANDIFTGTPPLGFAYGIGALLLFPMYARAATVLLEDISLDSLVNAIETFKVSVLFTAPTAYRALLESFTEEQLSPLKKCISAGEALPAYISEKWLEKTGIRLIDGIGSTELLHIFIAIQHPDDPIGSLGKAIPGYEARVIDKEGNDTPIGETGYLAVRGPTGCRYLNDDRQRDYVINGWNVTGDTVKMDEEGYIWYQARNDGMIISSGYNIAGPEVEQTVAQHPSVAECAVIGVPDADRGNIVKAYIVLKESFTPSPNLIKDIQAFSKQNSAPYKYPRAIQFIDALPRTPTGKVQHFLLRQDSAAS